MSLLKEFLTHVLPNEGWHGAFILETKKHFWSRGIEPLADFILRSDADGHTVYHACASFKEKSRKAAAAMCAKSLWCEVDAGPGKPYADARAAAQATQQWCELVGLPEPTYVGSGAGLHLYWPLLQTLEPEVWHRYATALRSLSESSGFHTDPVRTADLASVLRSPGTTNRKRDPAVVVEVGPLTGPYELAQFKVLENVTVSHNQRRDPAPPIAAGLSNTHEAVPRFLQSISEQCGQVKQFREKAGRIPEPLWHAALGVAAFCEDGRELGHEWSRGDERYSEQQTDSYLSRTGKFGPTTCKTFHAKGGKEICEACPHWGKIKSPIVLSDRPTPVSTPISQASAGPSVQKPKGSLDGFGYAKDGKLVALSSTNMGPVETPVADFRLELVSLHTEEIGAESNFGFRQVLPHEGRQAFTLPARAVFGHGASAEFAAKGALIYDYTEFLRYSRGMIRLLRDAGKDTVQYEQFGWKDDESAFLFGLKLYTCEGVEDAQGNKELQTRCKEDWIGPCKRGDLDTWKRTVNALFTVGCEPQSICLLASFAAPLMRLCDAIEGGAIIHLNTRDTGKGKSTGLIGAASVWGKKPGLGLTNEDTQVSKSLTLGALGNLPVIHDELSLRDPDIVRDKVMEFSNGRAKMRATRSGEIRHTASTWQTIMLSAANMSLIDVLSAGTGPNAARWRVIEFPFSLPPELKHQFGDKLRNTLDANSGYAGDVYLRWLVPNVAWVKQQLEITIQDIWQATTWPSDCRFWVRTIAAILVATKIVSDLGLVDCSPARIREWLLANIVYEDPNSLGENWAIDTLNRFIRVHNNNCLVMPGPFTAGAFKDLSSRNRPEQLPKGELVMRSEISTNKLYIAIGALRDWLIEQNVSQRELVKKLQEDEIITDSRYRMTLAAGTDLPGGREWCVEVNLAHAAMTGITNVLAFPQQPTRSSSEEDDVLPPQPS